jgi:death-on-curing protein
MSKITVFPTLEEALWLHKILIEIFGGKYGVRDQGLLESALARPKSGYYETLTMQAGALLHSLCLNHCFIDGNKRVAFALTAAFLKVNGYSLVTNANEAEELITQHIIQDKIDASDIATWLEKRIKKA